MCRILAYAGPPRDLVPYLLGRERSMQALACAHNDGWGVASWGPGGRVVHKAPRTAETDPGFMAMAKRTASSPVVWHIRRSSSGGRTMENTHPFAYGAWVFVHNGTVKGLTQTAGDAREKALTGLRGELRANVAGVTDSELLFHLVLEEIWGRNGSVDVGLAEAAAALRDVATRTLTEPPGGPRASEATLVMGNGAGFAVFRHGRELESVALDDGVLVASEPVGPEATWRPVPEGRAIVVADGSLRVL